MTHDPNQPYQPQQPAYQQGPPPGYQGMPPQQGWQQGPPPKKKHTARNVILGGIGALVLIGIIAAAAGGSKKNDTADSSTVSGTGTIAATAKASSKAAPAPGVSKGLGSKDATGDIKIGQPDASNGFDIEVPVTATNSSSKRSDYMVSLSLESADGKTQYDTASAFLQNVEPGQTAADKAIFIKQSKLPAGAKITVKEVQRLAST
ncbi:MAG TPA: hypothetical protein VHO01_16500 [Jatrophihabitans sp.]|nr:hypothetical protein [Jatrophihabitans sp.]